MTETDTVIAALDDTRASRCCGWSWTARAPSPTALIYAATTST